MLDLIFQEVVEFLKKPNFMQVIEFYRQFLIFVGGENFDINQVRKLFKFEKFKLTIFFFCNYFQGFSSNDTIYSTKWKYYYSFL